MTESLGIKGKTGPCHRCDIYLRTVSVLTISPPWASRLDNGVHFTHRRHEGRGSDGLTAMEAEGGSDTAIGLQPGLSDVEVHAVDAFDLKSHLILEDLGGGP